MDMWLDTNTKPYMGSPTTPSDLTLSVIERSNLRSLRSSHKAAGLLFARDLFADFCDHI